jgi:putative colanic acid biosynthesis acetyltransferase WcaF
MGDFDLYEVPCFTLRNRIARGIWGVVYTTLFRASPRSFHGWRRFLLKCFGAKLGKRCRIYAKATIWAPWNLVCDELATIADGAIIYNPSLITLGSHSIVSQQAYLCGATHDFDDPAFPLISAPISLGAYSWVCARATVQMGVSLGEGSVLGLGAIATKNLEPWSIYAGVPAKKIKDRNYNVASK